MTEAEIQALAMARIQTLLTDMGQEHGLDLLLVSLISPLQMHVLEGLEAGLAESNLYSRPIQVGVICRPKVASVSKEK